MTTTFADLGVSDDLCAALASRGITEPFSIQTIAIPDALQGHDVCGKAKTGSGKTLAFGIPVLERIGTAKPKRPLAIALVPTRELAVQVAEELEPLAKSRGVRISAVYGGANIERQITKLEKGVDFVVATPGRMIDLVERKAVNLEDLTHVIVDEADRMADMGFLPQVEWLLRQAKNEHQTLLFSATLDGVVDSLVRRYQTDPVFHEVESPEVTVDEMTHRFIQVHGMDKIKVAAAISESSDRTIMFTATKHMADRLASSLNDLGVDAAAIHGDLRQNHREKALNDFGDGKLSVLVATDVAARGIHVDDVGVVIHFDPPSEHKTYLHRSGRTARAGSKGLVITLVLFNEELEVRRMQKRVGLNIPVVEMFSNDPRLADLAGWDPSI
ncbi:MAG: DEAD/DEAH box helicase [Acidimicrobiia bacterium]|nr:DEAD/DEAH box helicase [Acidimicrobiia bacterium]